MLDSSNDTVAILYDIENAPIEMLQYTIDKAQRYQPCRMIIVSDWEAHPEQKRWDRLMQYPDFTFYDSAQILYQEGVRKYFIITTDSDFVRIAESLNAEDPSYIIGVGTKQASEDLRNAYNEFFVYPPERKSGKDNTAKDHENQNTEETSMAKKKSTEDKNVKNGQKTIAEKAGKVQEQKKRTAKVVKKKNAPENKSEEITIKEPQKSELKSKKKPPQKSGGSADLLMNGFLAVRLPKTLRTSLEKKMLEEEVSLDELVTYLLMRGLSAK